MSLKSRIGFRVKHARQAKNLTQAQLAERLDKAVETISNLERGTSLTGIETLQEIGEALGVPLGYFFESIEDRRAVSEGRIELEESLLATVRQLSDPNLRLAIALVQTVAANK